jgi:hypothetical protein
MYEKRFKKTCIKEKGKLEGGGIHQPFYDTWVVDFMLRQDAGKFMLEKYLSNAQIPLLEAKETFKDVCGRNYANS